MRFSSRHCSRGLLALLSTVMLCSNIQAEEPPAAQLQSEAATLYEQGRYQEAIPLEQRALEIRETVLGSDNAYTAQALDSLAMLYQSTGAYTKAAPLYQRALAIDEKVLGSEHVETAKVLNDLASLYDDRGEYEKALQLYQRVVAIREKVFGEQHPDTAQSLSNLALLYVRLGAYMSAEALYKQALAIYEKVLGPEHLKTADTLVKLGAMYDETGRFAMAEPLYRRALTIDEKVLGPENPRTSTALSALGGLYDDMASYTMAEQLYQRALAIDQKVLGPEHPDVATLLGHLGILYLHSGAYTKAEPMLQRALEIRNKVLGPEHPGTAQSLSDLAGLYFMQGGAYAKAEPLAERALAIYEKVLGPGHPQTANALGRVATLYAQAGAYAKAGSLIQRALAIDQKVLGAEHPETANAFFSLAEVYMYAGAYEKAEPLLQRALEIRNKVLGPEHPGTALSLKRLGDLYLSTGAYAKAEPLFQSALAISENALGPEDTATALVLNSLASLYANTGSYSKAEPLYRRAVTIYEKVLSPEHPDTAQAINNLATVYDNMHNLAKAESLYQRALAIREKVLGPEHPDTAQTLGNLGAMYRDTGAYVKAEPLLLRALAIYKNALGTEHPSTGRAHFDLALLYFYSAAYANAERSFERAQGIEESNTQRFLLSGSEERQRDYVQLQMRSTFYYVSFSLAYPTAESTALGLTSVLQYKGRVLDATSGSYAQLRNSVAPQDRALIDNLSAVAQEESTLTYSPPPKMTSNILRERLATLAQEREQLQARLSSRSAEFRKSVMPITLDSVRQRIPSDTLLAEFFRYRPVDPKTAHLTAPRYVVYVLQRSGKTSSVDLGPAQPIDDLVLEFRGALSDPRKTTYNEVAKELYEKLIKPIHPYMGRGERLLLSPDAQLNLIPFSALVDEHGDYLIQKHEVSYLTSGRDLLRMVAEPPPRGNAVVLADPNYGQPARAGSVSHDAGPRTALSAYLDHSGPFTGLQATAKEAERLSALLKLDAQSVLTGDRATEASLRALHGPRILHMATHAFFLSDQDLAAGLQGPGLNPSGMQLTLGENLLLRSGLALAGANARQSGETDVGILTAAEVAQLDLAGTQLAVLSACDTGVGAVQTGEGVYGLRRALVLAGAQAQLVSLWKVADSATQELMVSYYQRLLNGEGRAAALRAVQLKMIANGTFQHPYYWAAFMPYGDWSPLAQESHRQSLALVALKLLYTVGACYALFRAVRRVWRVHLEKRA